MAKKAMIEREKKRARLVNRYAAKRAELKEKAKDDLCLNDLKGVDLSLSVRRDPCCNLRLLWELDV